MLITLTIIDQKKDKPIDIQVNPLQKIRDTLEILMENNRIQRGELLDNVQVKSERKREYINTWLTYEQADIDTGDCLVLS